MDPAMTSGVTDEPVVVDGTEPASDPERADRFAESAHRILADLVIQQRQPTGRVGHVDSRWFLNDHGSADPTQNHPAE